MDVRVKQLAEKKEVKELKWRMRGRGELRYADRKGNGLMGTNLTFTSVPIALEDG